MSTPDVAFCCANTRLYFDSAAKGNDQRVLSNVESSASSVKTCQWQLRNQGQAGILA